MIDATNSAFLIPSEEQTGPAVRTMLIEYPDFPVGGSEHDEILFKQTKPNRRLVGVGHFRQHHARDPERSEIFAHKGAGIGLGKSRVFLGRHHWLVLPDDRRPSRRTALLPASL
jgi:hypothetical protein